MVGLILVQGHSARQVTPHVVEPGAFTTTSLPLTTLKTVILSHCVRKSTIHYESLHCTSVTVALVYPGTGDIVCGTH